MASQDFVELMKKLHDEKYRMLSHHTHYDGTANVPSLKVTVILTKGGKQVSIESSEWDFVRYVTELRGIADMTGEHRFTRIKDLNQYNADVEHLIDLDRSKIKSAVEEIKSGKFTREYSPSRLIDEFLGNKKNIKDVKFLPLKRDYHHILAGALLESKAMLKAREALSPMLNLVRIGLEIRRGNNSPSKHCELAENIRILKSDTEFGQLFVCLDEQIRHASAHASFRIDKAVRKVYLMDERASKGNIVRTYTFDELTNMLNSMDNEFFPVIYPTLVIFDIAMLDLLLVSREYKHLLLALGNC